MERRGPILLLTLRRPDRLNAVSMEMYDALMDALESVGEAEGIGGIVGPGNGGEGDDGWPIGGEETGGDAESRSAAGAPDSPVRAVVVTGAGRAFCVGADLVAHGEAPPDEETRRRYAGRARDVARRLQTLPVPVVAGVNGHAVGAGLELALSCDLVVVAREAKLRLPEAALGTFVGGGVVRTLARRIGEARAREILLLCPFLRGEEAHDLGVANRCCDAAAVLPLALELASELARRAPTSVALLKALLFEAPGLSMDEVMEREVDALVRCMGTEDWAEGVRAFAERREPRYRGR